MRRLVTDLSQQVAIVTGAGAGLGRAYAEALAGTGASVVANDITETAHETVDRIVASGARAVASIRDIATPEGAAALVSDAIAAFGGIHAVVNNAGLLRDADLQNITDDDWRRVLAVNLDAPFFVTRAAWPHLRKQGYGRLVFMTSASGLFGNVGHAFYSASKAGVVGLMKACALEGAGHGILANAVAPLAVSAQSLANAPSGSSRVSSRDIVGPAFSRFTPEQVARLVVLLCGPGFARTGAVFASAGGFTREVLTATTRGADFSNAQPEEMAQRWAEVAAGELDTPASLREDMLLLRSRLPS
jgi:NAD(P)-dependent dehydrogenase (short-subunit alcohol dehydrogenase family)